MIEAWYATGIRAAEQPLLDAGVPLMDRAAFALATQIGADLRAARGRVAGARVALLVGSGNNGGDALCAGALLRRRGVAVTAFLLGSTAHEGGLAALRAAGGRAVAVPDDGAEGACAQVWAHDAIVDGVLGIGARRHRGALDGIAHEVVCLLADRVRRADHEGVVARRPRVVAVDVPSGIGVDDGAVPGVVLPADRTVTFGGAKAGLILPPAACLAGVVTPVDIGLPAPVAVAARRLETTDVGASWPVPGASDHKYTRGVVGVVAGTPTYPGAGVLACAAAARAGAGMVRYVGAVPDRVLAARPEVVTAPGRVQAWVVGPGLPTDDEAGQHDVVRSVLRSAIGNVPVVVDAGALSLLPARVPPSVVITPHAGELATLLRALSHDVDRAGVEADPVRWATLAHRATGATVLLKGGITVVVGGDPGDPDVYAQADGPGWLATAGSGDVLAGVLGAMLAAGSEVLDTPGGPARVAASAALVHGRAAALAGEGGPVVALDVADAVPRAVLEALVAAGRVAS